MRITEKQLLIRLARILYNVSIARTNWEYLKLPEIKQDMLVHEKALQDLMEDIVEDEPEKP